MTNALAVLFTIMQRLHEDDLVGHLVQQSGWRVVKFPAIAEQDETHIVQTLNCRKTITRRQGKLCTPIGEPLEVLSQIFVKFRASTTLPASISKRRRLWAADW